MGVKPLDYTQTLYIPGLEAFDPELSVIIVDLNYPTGQVIPIETIMAGPKAQTNGTSITKPSTLTPAGGPGPVIPIQSIPDPVEITVIYRNPFTITASTSFAYAISEKHNDFSLVLETARYEKNNVSWTYNSLQTGITDVIITTDSEISILGAPMITKTVCIINVISPVNILPVPLPEEILSFKGRVVIAQRLVQEQYKSAALVCVDVKTPSPVPVTDPLRLSYMRCVFVVENGMVSIGSNG